MNWIKATDRLPDVGIDGDKVLICRMMNDSQKNMHMSIYSTQILKYCNKEKTWWMRLPEKPII